ncbi:MAG TPA: hypothetical protein VH309_14085 [Elusimicrobiota bacterium]|jgi:hypothetical protein|nr:hypothetical protein [Elusimicrobiota bacterium]
MKRPALEPFDWLAFRRTFPFQPVPVWIAAALLLRPAARATPFLLRATCSGPARDGVANLALVVYALVLPAGAASLVYLLAGRRRMSRQLRFMGDFCLALVLLISAANAVSLARQARAGWTTLRPGLHSLRDACWK